MGFSAVTDELRNAAGKARSAGERASDVKPAEAVRDLNEALPGADPSANAAGRLFDTWRETVSRWSEAARRHGEALASSADTYEGTDAAGDDRFGRLMGEPS